MYRRFEAPKVHGRYNNIIRSQQGETQKSCIEEMRHYEVLSRELPPQRARAPLNRDVQRITILICRIQITADIAIGLGLNCLQPNGSSTGFVLLNHG